MFYFRIVVFYLMSMWMLIGSLFAEVSISDFDLPQQSDDGWTRLEPSADSRLIYVHASAGDDESALVYAVDDVDIGSDPTRPVGSVLPFSSIEAARQHLRKGKPDWLLLARGEHWYESLRLGAGEFSRPMGRSATERLVVTAWGQGARPELRTSKTQRGIHHNQLSNAIISSIRFGPTQGILNLLILRE